MRHALNTPAMIGLHWNDETIVADRDELVLNRFGRTAHQSFKRARDARTEDVDLVTNVRQLRARAIVDLSARQNFIRDARDQRVELTRQILDQLPQHWRFIALGKNRCTRRHRLIAKTRRLEYREWIEARAFNTHSSNRFRRLSQSIEIPFNSARTQPHAFSERGERVAQLRRVVNRRKCFNATLPGFGLRVSFYQLQQMLVFESCKCLLVHEA